MFQQDRACQAKMSCSSSTECQAKTSCSSSTECQAKTSCSSSTECEAKTSRSCSTVCQAKTSCSSSTECEAKTSRSSRTERVKQIRHVPAGQSVSSKDVMSYCFVLFLDPFVQEIDTITEHHKQNQSVLVIVLFLFFLSLSMQILTSNLPSLHRFSLPQSRSVTNNHPKRPMHDRIPLDPGARVGKKEPQ